MEKEFGAKFENSAIWKILQHSAQWLMIICSVCCTTVIIVSCIMRYVFTKNWYGSDEIILTFAFWLYFMGAVYGSFEDSHIKADIIPTVVKNMRTKDSITLVAAVLLVIINALLIIWAFPYFWEGVVKMPATTALKIPLLIPRMAILLGLIWMEFYHVYYAIKKVYNFTHRGYYSTPNEYDYFPEKLMAKYPNTDLRTKAQVDSEREAERTAAELELQGKPVEEKRKEE